MLSAHLENMFMHELCCSYSCKV